MTIGEVWVTGQRRQWIARDYEPLSYEHVTYRWRRPAVIKAGLALHWNDWDGEPALYVISHCKSGMRITQFEDRNNAVMALKALTELANWESIPVPISPELAKQVWELLEPLTDVDPFYIDDDEL